MARNDQDDDRYDDEDYIEEAPAPATGDFLDSLQDQFGSAPWWVISAVVHTIILIVLAFVVLVSKMPQPNRRVVEQTVPPRPQPERPPRRERALFKSERTIDMPAVEHPLIVHEKIEIDPLETENKIEQQTARGQEDAISDIPLGQTGVSGNIGISGGGAGAYGFRTGGGRKRAALARGGSRASESAVDAALRWLARHQERDGRWDGEKWEGKDTDVGITGLAVLAFLGAGHTSKTGRFKDNVRRGVKWLIKQQHGNGQLGGAVGTGGSHGIGYHHAIAGLALAEAFGMAGKPATRKAAQKALKYSVESHQKSYSGWRYTPKDDADLSVTGWFVMQLKSAKVAGLRVDGSGFQGATKFLDEVTAQGENGSVYKYQAKDRRPTYTMSAVGGLCRLFMGWKPSDPEVMGSASFLLEDLPRWEDGDRGVNFYKWYYGTLVMFQVGGDHWKQWNESLRDMLVENQRKEPDPKVDGSWDPAGIWCASGGRVYSTAVACLCLEVYYRYLPMYR